MITRSIPIILSTHLVRQVLLIDTQCSSLQKPLGGTGLALPVLRPGLHGLKLLLCCHSVALHSEPEEQLCLRPGGLHEVWMNRHTAAIIVCANTQSTNCK